MKESILAELQSTIQVLQDSLEEALGQLEEVRHTQPRPTHPTREGPGPLSAGWNIFEANRARAAEEEQKKLELETSMEVLRLKQHECEEWKLQACVDPARVWNSSP